MLGCVGLPSDEKLLFWPGMDPLERFISAQQPVYAQALAELRAGRKQTHWMWFVFPQLRGLGSSAMAEHYGIDGRAEAEAYLRHPVLGRRLRECAAAVNALEGTTVPAIFGSPDDLKFRSSVTLFAAVDEPGGVFEGSLRKYFAGVGDQRTLGLLA